MAHRCKEIILEPEDALDPENVIIDFLDDFPPVGNGRSNIYHDLWEDWLEQAQAKKPQVARISMPSVRRAHMQRQELKKYADIEYGPDSFDIRQRGESITIRAL